MKCTAPLGFFAALLPFTLASVACDTGGKSPYGGEGGQAGSPAGSAGTTGTAGAGDTIIEGLLIDDFEDGDGMPLVPGGWYGFTDVSNGGGSTLTFTGATGTAVAMNGAGYQSMKSLEVAYSFDQGSLAYSPYVGVGVSLGSRATPVDFSAYAGIAYTYQGGAHRIQLSTTDVTDYDYYGVSLLASPTWKTVTLPFSAFAQENWGERVPLDLTHVTDIGFQIRGTTGASGKFQIDNLVAMDRTVASPPDMAIRPATPPADTVIDSIEIDSPLQARAMQYLNRGYNVTNWLEQGRFDGFTYDEAFVEQLADAGFKGLRLPIDFDLYVESTSGSGDSLSVTVHDDLFEILDSFETWTATHGLSLTIDYHQYTTLLDKSDPVSVDTAVALWGVVAEHFAANPREDLFFELVNEPELSFDGTDPTSAEWGAIAERMISAIRANDTTHTIIFGDTNWYGIDKLVNRTPFSDENIIYAFHFYAPFVFTHQGAPWANMGASHDLPYPYDPERWSEYFADLGFNAFMESWILQEVRNYYQTGNRSAMRNSILSAKRWAVTHQVPVICNEFGVYDATSRLEDRARYYSDLVGIFEELEIPWQHWFMIMDDSGTVIPEYREAMRLDD